MALLQQAAALYARESNGYQFVTAMLALTAFALMLQGVVSLLPRRRQNGPLQMPLPVPLPPPAQREAFGQRIRASVAYRKRGVNAPKKFQPTVPKIARTGHSGAIWELAPAQQTGNVEALPVAPLRQA